MVFVADTILAWHNPQALVRKEAKLFRVDEVAVFHFFKAFLWEPNVVGGVVCVVAQADEELTKSTKHFPLDCSVLSAGCRVVEVYSRLGEVV